MLPDRTHAVYDRAPAQLHPCCHELRAAITEGSDRNVPANAPSRESWLTRRSKWFARGVANRLRDFGAAEPEGFELSDVPQADVCLYFADQPSKLYQLAQWLPIFEARTDITTVIAVRHVETYDALLGTTPLKILLVPRYEVLMAMYDRANFHAVIYVNNGWTNFQSLAFQQAVHIHVNHGESDKICMVSNQAKAYDKVFVAGEAAIRRHQAALAWFDPSHLVRVGRPQLDLEVVNPLGAHDGPTITYAPTWEGEDDANNYTSLDLYGVSIITAALAQPGARVIYKPHPRVPSSDDAGVRAAHSEIVRMIKAAAAANPEAGHAVMIKGNVLGVIRGTDLMIADVSSVTLDHLYLRPDAPIVLCDRRTERDLLLSDAPLAAAVHVLDQNNVATLGADLAQLIGNDPNRDQRHAMRDFYFDGIAPGASTERFWQELTTAMHEHDSAIGNLSRIRVVQNLKNEQQPKEPA